VRSALLEDIAYAHIVKSRGYRIGFACGFDMGCTRMYLSLRDVWAGWSRIFYGAFQGSIPLLLVSVLFLSVFSLFQYFSLVYSAAGLVRTPSNTGLLVLLVLSACSVVTTIWFLARLARLSRCESIYAALHPVSALIAFGILLSAIAKRFSRKGIIWRGTRYETRGNSISLR
jgi:uncharacterized BrkB/YihY/UPF0761 family membrane protein